MNSEHMKTMLSSVRYIGVHILPSYLNSSDELVTHVTLQLVWKSSQHDTILMSVVDLMSANNEPS
jgi:hypothetical protein